VRSTPLEQAAHGVCTRRSAASKRVEVAVVGEHNSPSRLTSRPRDHFQVHELAGDTGRDGTLPILERDSSWPDDYSPGEDAPSKQTPVYQSICTSYFISM
jgi:hypothetical protein